MGIAVAQLPVEGAPQVGITVTGLDPVDESVISVEVSWDGGSSWHGVRGAEKVAVTGSAFFRDFVPPLNLEATYRVVVHSGTWDTIPARTWAVASDSTGVGPDKWVQQAVANLAAGSATAACDVKLWNDATQAYDTSRIQHGVVSRVVALRDEFARSAADIVGTSPDVGAAWEAPFAGSNGDWSLDGSGAVATSDTDRQFVLAPLGATGDVEIAADLIIGSPPAPANIAVYAKYVDFFNFVQCIVSRTASTLQMSIVKRIAGTFTTVASVTNMSPPSDGVLALRAQAVGTSVTLSVNDVAIEGVLAAGDVTALAPSQKAGFGSSATSTSGARVDRFQVDLINASASDVITLYNGARSGSILDYQIDRIEDMYPVAVGVLLVNSIHNYGTRTVEEYLANLDEFVTAFLELHPGTPVVVTSQNPEFPPQTNIALHAQRNAALAVHAGERGWGYIPAFEAFSALPDGGLSLMNSDGLHPSYGGRSTGAAFWRDVALEYFQQVHDEATVTVTSDTAWIQDPLDPRGAVPVDAEYDNGTGAWTLASTAASVMRRQVADVVSVEGSRYPVASVGVRQAPSSVPIFLRAASAQGEMVRRLRALFDEAGVLVIRGMHSDCPLDPVAHVIAGDIEEVPVVGGLPGFRNDWHLVVDQVRPTSMKIVVPWFTYDQVKALWDEWAPASTYDQVIAARPGDTYLDWQRYPEVP